MKCTGEVFKAPFPFRMQSNVVFAFQVKRFGKDRDAQRRFGGFAFITNTSEPEGCFVKVTGSFAFREDKLFLDLKERP